MKDIKTINKAITAIATSGKKLDAAIQACAVDVMEHFMEHRDTGLVNRLYLALPKGSRGLALADWLLKFVAVKVNTNKETKAESPFVYAAEKVEAMMAEGRLELARTTLWHDLKREKSLDEAFDVLAGFKALLRKIEHSTKVEHFNRDALVAFGAAIGVPESDIPTKPGLKSKQAEAVKAADVLATLPAAEM